MIRDEQPYDLEAIRSVIAAAFTDHPYSNQREHALVDALRDSGTLTLSLVAEDDGAIVGHVAFSPVRIGGELQGWYGLGSVSVQSAHQRQGIGRALIEAGLKRLRDLNAGGCVLLGKPEYYGRFGFKQEPQLRLEGVPPEFFLALPLGQSVPNGSVDYHPIFAEVA